jgi:hypothetical protein
LGIIIFHQIHPFLKGIQKKICIPGIHSGGNFSALHHANGMYKKAGEKKDPIEV